MEKWIEENNRDLIKALAEQIDLNHVLPYIGAGMSMPLFPGWGAYLEELVQAFGIQAGSQAGDGSAPHGNPYEELAQEMYDKYPIQFQKRTKKIFAPEKIRMDDLGDSVKLLPQLFRCPMITTNLDRVLEAVYTEHGVPMEVALAGETGFIHDRMISHRPVLWKIHGDIEKSDEWVLTGSQYRQRYESGQHQAGVSSFEDLFERCLQTKCLLFLGCSLEEDRVVSLLRQLFQENHAIRHFAILPLPEPADVMARESVLENRGIQAIWYENRQGDHSGAADILRQVLELVGRRYTDRYGVPDQSKFPSGDPVKKKDTMI